MTIDAAVLRAMAAAGATVEIIIAAVEADALKDVERREAKREGNAERQRRFKAKRRGNKGNALPTVTPPIEEIIPPVPSNEETTPQAAAKRPEGVSEQVFSDFVKLRKAQRAPVTPTALAGIASEAEKAGWTLEAAMSEQVSRGWRGFKADWVNAAKPPGSPNDDLAARILKRQAANA